MFVLHHKKFVRFVESEMTFSLYYYRQKLDINPMKSFFKKIAAKCRIKWMTRKPSAYWKGSVQLGAAI